MEGDTRREHTHKIIDPVQIKSNFFTDTNRMSRYSHQMVGTLCSLNARKMFSSITIMK